MAKVARNILLLSAIFILCFQARAGENTTLLQQWRAGHYQAVLSALMKARQVPANRNAVSYYWIAACYSRLPGQSPEAMRLLQGVKTCFDLTDSSQNAVDNALERAKRGQPIDLVPIRCKTWSSRRERVLFNSGGVRVQFQSDFPSPEVFRERELPLLSAGEGITESSAPLSFETALASPYSAPDEANIAATVASDLGSQARFQTSPHFIVVSRVTSVDMNLDQLASELEQAHAFLSQKLMLPASTERITVYILNNQDDLAQFAKKQDGLLLQSDVSLAGYFAPDTRTLIAQRPIKNYWRLDPGKVQTRFGASTDYESLRSFLFPNVMAALLLENSPDAPFWFQQGLLAYAGNLKIVDGKITPPMPGDILKQSPLPKELGLKELWASQASDFASDSSSRGRWFNLAQNFVLYLDGQGQLGTFYSHATTHDPLDAATDWATFASGILDTSAKNIQPKFILWCQQTRDT